MLHVVTVNLNGVDRKFCADCGQAVGTGSFEEFNHRNREECPYLASGKYFIPDDVRVRDAIARYNFIPHQVNV